MRISHRGAEEFRGCNPNYLGKGFRQQTRRLCRAHIGDRVRCIALPSSTRRSGTLVGRNPGTWFSDRLIKHLGPLPSLLIVLTPADDEDERPPSMIPLASLIVLLGIMFIFILAILSIVGVRTPSPTSLRSLCPWP